MAEGGQRSAFSIAANRPFADDLAAGLLARIPDRLALARTLLLLPTRRAIRALTEAFVRESEGRALLLPRMVAIADLDSEASGWASPGALVEELAAEAQLLPGIAPLARRLALAGILARGRHIAVAEALALADRLAAALDTLEIDGCRAADIAGAVPGGLLQQHWLQNAEVLQVVAEHWPLILAERGLMEGTRRRNLQLAGLADRWTQAPPATPVVLAGFAAAPPAVAQLAATVVRLPAGTLVLPGLDMALDAETLDCLRPSEARPGLETHPQHGMVQLLDAAGIAVQEVLPWPAQSARAGSAPERARLVAGALRPARAGILPPTPADATAQAGLVMLAAAGPSEEALAIALAMRQVVEHRGRTAALVTPDRALARRVRVQLQRFGIEIDDSAGEPLAASGPGSLLVALATAAAESFAPVPLLGALLHPLVRAGEARLAWLGQVRALDLQALRGVRPGRGLAGIARRLRHGKATAELQRWWQDEATPLLALLAELPSAADALLDALRDVAVALAGSELWAGEAGRALAALFDDAEQCRADLAALSVPRDEAAAFVTALLAGRVVRPRVNRHPQLRIWGPLEARLQTADLMILGGLNESSWPGEHVPDPFLAPAIRRALRLPGLERRIGLQAHDFASALGAPEVLLTRSVRAGGAPTVASRFWQRLQAALGGLPDAGHLLPARAALLAAARGLETPPRAPAIVRPAPAPPVAARPKAITVTDVAMLKADPFSFYAKRILRLKPLEARDAEPTAGDRGQIVHAILKRLLDIGAPPPADVAQAIDTEIAAVADRPEIAALWRPRVDRMVAWALDTLAAQPEWQPVAWEAEGRLDLGRVTLIGRIDRLDRRGDELRIVDYKTGTPPSQKEVRGLYQTQLALLGLLAEKGLFGVAGAEVGSLEYWQLGGGREPGAVKPALGARANAHDIANHLADVDADLRGLVAGWLLGTRPFASKLSMVFGRRFRDYDHLARVAEWLDQ